CRIGPCGSGRRFRDQVLKKGTGYQDYRLLLSWGSFEQSCETINVRSACIADHEIAKPTLTPCFHIERQFARQRRAVSQPCRQGPFLKYEHGNMVLPYVVNQMSTRGLLKIGHSPAQQREAAILEFRQIERERNSSLEPGLHR